MQKHFIEIADFTGEQLMGLIDRTLSETPLYKKGEGPQPLKGQVLAMIFEKPSLRTRVSFEVAMTQLGGAAIYLTPGEIGIGTREPVQDVARVLGRLCRGIMARTFSHQLIKDLAAYAEVPIINGLSDYNHPCQAMADLTTVKGHFGNLDGRHMAFVGDGNNVARSLMLACAKLGMAFTLICPEGYDLEDFEEIAAGFPNARLLQTHDPTAVKDADVIYTDTWVSMGQEEEKAQRIDDFKGYQVNAELMKQAPEHAIVLHCLPAYRGFEITDEVFETNAAYILDEAENRLHVQRTILRALMEDGGIV